MPLEHKGLVKLAEECGELIQAAMKRIAFDGDGDIHWDGSNMRERLADEMADVRAACAVVEELWDLDSLRIVNRSRAKRDLFLYWQNGGKEISIPTSGGQKQ